MIPVYEEFQNEVVRFFPEIKSSPIPGITRTVRNVTIQVTEDCNLRCKYCYQINKSPHKIDAKVAKKFLSMIIDGDNPYINQDNTCGLILEFIGGEPFMAIDVIDEITEWFLFKLIDERNPWLMYTRISICSNGVLYRDKRVQQYLDKYGWFVSLAITVDGNKQLHDSCRVFPDGRGSYEYAIDASMDVFKRSGGHVGTKITIAPDNIAYLKDAIVDFIDHGYRVIYANCVYEQGWTLDHAKILYSQMKSISDWLFDNELYDDVNITLFRENGFHPMDPSENRNWCGGTGDMIAVNWTGNIYPCLRYMESSLGSEADPIIIGTVDKGIQKTEKQNTCVECLKSITRRTQSTDECFNCPIAEGCSWCSAYNYQIYGTPNKRATFICVMHKARALANAYFWNRYYRAIQSDKRFINYVPREWALEIISEEELDKLNELSK